MKADTEQLQELMRRALAGDGRAYSEALTEVARVLRPYLSKRLGNKAEVEDVLQEILISIHKARHTYDGNRPFGPWMFAIAKFRLQDHLRALYSDKLRFAGELTEAENIPEQAVTESPFTYESIKEEVGRLPEKQAAILQLMHEEGHTAKEVAAKLGMQESAVKVAAHRAYKVLRKKLTG